MGESPMRASMADRMTDDRHGGAGPLKVCLITSLSIADFVDPELTAESAKPIMPGNVGVLTLAAVLRSHGYDPCVVNLDQLFLRFRGLSEPRSDIETEGRIEAQARPSSDEPVAPYDRSATYFFPFVIGHLKSLSFDVFGLSSICSSYPLTVRLADELRRLNPASRIILGGPQASVVDVATMRAFGCVDFVVRGEAEESFPVLLDLLSGRKPHITLESIPGITFRRGDDVVRNPNAPVIKDLDSLPSPAFDLDTEFKDRGSVYLEIGRGCPFACTFCSTNDFFRRNFRLKSTQKMIDEMTYIKDSYGIGNFSFIHDMYTIDHKKVAAFCEAVLADGGGFIWACSARTDCIDDELIALMAKAGCRGIFFGIETGSARLQTVIKKKLDLEEARQRIACADRYGVKTAVALICAFPDETRDDFRDTIHYFIDSLRFDNAEPQLSLLAPLAATPIYEEHKQELILDHIFSDVSHQGWQQDPADIELITLHQDVFPNFYAVPTRALERSYFREVRDLVTYLALRFRWLPVALMQDSGDFLSVFDRWKRWSAERDCRSAEPGAGVVPYYCGPHFRPDFLEFVRSCYVPEMARAPEVIAAVVHGEATSHANIAKTERTDVKRTDRLDKANYPFRPQRSTLQKFGVDYKELVEALRMRTDLGKISPRSGTVVFRHENNKQVQVWQVTPSSALLMRLCNGRRTVEEITREFGRLQTAPASVPAHKACLFGLMTLQQSGLIEIASHPVAPDGAEIDEDEAASVPHYVPPPEISNTQQPWPWRHNAAS